MLKQTCGMGLGANAPASAVVVSILWSLGACSKDVAPLVWACLLVSLSILGPLMSKLTTQPSEMRAQTSQYEEKQMGNLPFPVHWTFLPSNGVYCVNQPTQAHAENDLCTLRAHLIHKPTHSPAHDATGDYPFSSRLQGRRRFWECRYQLRLKKLPESKLCFGIELGTFVKVSGMASQVQSALLHALRAIVGDFYHSLGDDPQRTRGEVELPAFVMPLWAFDQFIISEPGEEPDLTADLSGIGVRRTEEGIQRYVEAARQMENSLSTDKVYTFCFWGISRFLDCGRWEICGFPRLPGLRLNFNELCGTPPVYLCIYELAKDLENRACCDHRHLQSMKRYYSRIALWSAFVPPSQEVLDRLLGSQARQAREMADGYREKQNRNCMLFGALSCCTGGEKHRR